MFFDSWGVFLHQILKKLNSEFNLTFGTMIKVQEMEGVNEVREAIYHLIVLLFGKHTHKNL